MRREKRIYTPVTDLETEIGRRKELGKTRKEISDILHLPNALQFLHLRLK